LKTFSILLVSTPFAPFTFSVTGLEPDTVSLAAFYIAALLLFLQGVSLAANFLLRRIKNSAAETFNLSKLKIFI
jgi:hypothetical protein